MATVNDLLAALKVLWDADATLSSISGPYFGAKPPELSTGFPYAVVELRQSNLVKYTNRDEIWSATIRLSVYNTTPELIGTAIGLMSTALSSANLPAMTPTGTTVAKGRITGEEMEREDKGVHRGTLVLDYTWAKPRA